MSLKRVLYISYDGMTDPLGQSQVLPYLVGLSSKGYSFELISFEKKHLFQNRKQHISEICSSNGITWTPLTYTKQPPVLSTIWDLLKLNRQVSKSIEKGIDWIHCRSYLPALIALRYKRKIKLPFLFDMRGFWADERVDGGIWSFKNPLFRAIYRYFKRKEKDFLSEAKHTISLTESAKSEILEWELLGLRGELISVIPCTADFDLFECNSTEKKAQAKKALGLSVDAPVLTYLGSIGTWYMLDEMLSYFEEMLKLRPSSVFLIITKDDQVALRNRIAVHQLPNESIRITSADREELPKLLMASDQSIFFILPAFSKKASSPTKMGELLAMGIPVIGNAGVGDVALLIENMDVGKVLNDFSIGSYRKVVSEMENYELQSPSRIRSKAESYLGLKTGIAKYEAVYKIMSPK
jgi:glycosyltransferase involved in cell wall biosynthesis